MQPGLLRYVVLTKAARWVSFAGAVPVSIARSAAGSGRRDPSASDKIWQDTRAILLAVCCRYLPSFTRRSSGFLTTTVQEDRSDMPPDQRTLADQSWSCSRAPQTLTAGRELAPFFGSISPTCSDQLVSSESRPVAELRKNRRRTPEDSGRPPTTARANKLWPDGRHEPSWTQVPARRGGRWASHHHQRPFG